MPTGTTGAAKAPKAVKLNFTIDKKGFATVTDGNIYCLAIPRGLNNETFQVWMDTIEHYVAVANTPDTKVPKGVTLVKGITFAKKADYYLASNSKGGVSFHPLPGLTLAKLGETWINTMRIGQRAVDNAK